MNAPSPPHRNVFVVSTGRTATRALATWMGRNVVNVAAWHEPFPSRLLRPLCNARAAGTVADTWLVRVLRVCIGSRRARAGDRTYIEASPYLRACVDLLPRVLDDPFVLHIVRDPRAYVTSYINHGAFVGVKGVAGAVMPYWQLKPEHVNEADGRTWASMSPHERICWRWENLNGLIEHGTARLPQGRYLRVRFEDIVDPARGGLQPVLEWLGLETVPELRSPALDLRENRSRRTIHPRPEEWSGDMRSVLERYCRQRMIRYGYDPGS